MKTIAYFGMAAFCMFVAFAVGDIYYLLFSLVFTLIGAPKYERR